MDYQALERPLSLQQKADLILSRDEWKGRGWLSEDQLRLRHYREVPVGLIQGGVYPGQFGRAYNPQLGKRPDPDHLQRLDPWGQLLWEYYR